MRAKRLKRGKSIQAGGSPEPLESEELLRTIVEVVNEEPPIHQEALVRRVARLMGYQKAGRRIKETVCRLAKARFQTTSEDIGEFFWKDDGEIGRCVSCRPGSDGNPRQVHEVAMPELLALARSLSPKPGENPVNLMGHYLGLQRVRSATRRRLGAAWERAAENT